MIFALKLYSNYSLVYGAARESHTERTTNTLKHSTGSHKWLEILKGSIFGVKPSIPALRRPEVVWWWLLLRKPHSWALFDSKQCREQFVTPLSCFPQSGYNSLASLILGTNLCATSVLLCLLLDLYTCGGVDAQGVFPLFLQKVTDIIAPKLSIIFRKLISLGQFPAGWRSANVTAISKYAPSPDGESYWPILMTPILSKVYEKLVPHKLPSFWEKYGLLPNAQFA